MSYYSVWAGFGIRVGVFAMASDSCEKSTIDDQKCCFSLLWMKNN
jgi:hypothetical protein